MKACSCASALDGSLQQACDSGCANCLDACSPLFALSGQMDSRMSKLGSYPTSVNITKYVSCLVAILTCQVAS